MPPLNQADMIRLEQDAKRENDEATAQGFRVVFELDITAALALCGNLQLSLRHPANRGPSSQIARDMVDQLRLGLEDRGYPGLARLISMSDDPAYDYEPAKVRARPARVKITTDPNRVQ